MYYFLSSFNLLPINCFILFNLIFYNVSYSCLTYNVSPSMPNDFIASCDLMTSSLLFTIDSLNYFICSRNFLTLAASNIYIIFSFIFCIFSISFQFFVLSVLILFIVSYSSLTFIVLIFIYLLYFSISPLISNVYLYFFPLLLRLFSSIPSINRYKIFIN